MIRLKSEISGEWITLCKKIASGGEADIYETSKSGFVAKIYTKSVTPDTWEKLRLMVNNPPQDPTLSKGHISIAWPECVLLDNIQIPKGFLLPYIGDTLEFSVIHHPEERKQKAPGFNWLYLHTTAMNIASVVQSIHAKNYVIGDINSRNFLVKSNTYVSIIDTDSFQVNDPRTQKVYRCIVGVEDYTPPELCGKNFRNVNRNEVQDRFGLAILIWQLLFNDHPFSGKWCGNGDSPSLSKKISEGHWVYGASSKIKPVLRTMPFNIIHPQLQILFRRCFNDGYHNPYVRPSANEWRNALELAIKDLQVCPVARKQHYYAKSYGKCYWCERNNQLGFDIFANPNVSSIPNILTFSSPSIIKAHINLVIPIPSILPTPTFTPKPVHPWIQSLQLAWTRFKAAKTQQWIALALFIFSISAYAGWQFSLKNTASQSSLTQGESQNLDPKDTIVKYYQLVPQDKNAAKQLLSDSWRNKLSKSAKDNWWNSINNVDVYAFKTFAKNTSNAKIKVWLKYYKKNGQISCESLIFHLIFDQNRNEWLMDSIESNSVVQKPSCDNT